MKYLRLLFLILFISCQRQSNKIEELSTNSDNKVLKFDSSKSDIETIDDEKGIIVDNKKNIGNSIGIITIIAERLTENDTIKIFNKDGSLWYKFSYFYDDSNGKYDFYNEDFNPLSFHPDYFLLALKVTSELNDYYEVVVNENTWIKKYIKKNNPLLKFQTWEEHILSSVFAVGFDENKNPLRSYPSLSADTLYYDKDEFYYPNQIKGEWLQVKWGSEGNWNYGWIKWKDKDRLLIEIFYFA